MHSTPPLPAPGPTLEQRFGALLDMGFERVEPGPATAESVRLPDGTQKLTQIRPAMGSFASITAMHDSQSLAEHAIGAAFEEMDRLVGLLNRFDASTALSYLNDAGTIVAAPPELVDVVAHGLAFTGATEGAFDVTVKPVIDLFRHPASYERLVTTPDDVDLRAAVALVGAGLVDVSGNDIRLPRAGMGLTLDGIAKGYIVDRLAGSLRRAGVSRFLINAGGDIRSSGTREDDTPWAVAVRNPDDGAPSWDADGWNRRSAADTIRLTDGAVATSGSYEVYYDRERLAHHIVQAGTGKSPQEATSVTVTAATTVAADALATAVFVLGPERGTRLIDRTVGCESLVIDRHGNQTRSRGWHRALAPRRAHT